MIVRALWCRLVGRNFNHHNRLRRIRFHVDGHHLATQCSGTAVSYTAVQYSSRYCRRARLGHVGRKVVAATAADRNRCFTYWYA